MSHSPLHPPRRCLHCGQPGWAVPSATVARFVRPEQQGKVALELQWHYCGQPGCELVYFGERLAFSLKDVTVRILPKDKSPQTPLCHCLGIFKQELLLEPTQAQALAIWNRIKAAQPQDCALHHPAGRPCLEELKAWLARAGLSLELL